MPRVLPQPHPEPRMRLRHIQIRHPPAITNRRARIGKFRLGINHLAVYLHGIGQHAQSIDAAANLNSSNFRCRFLITAPVWIRLAESVVISRYQPVWNAVVDGFGNHDPGGRRATQHRSRWDVFHPGRAWAEKLASPPVTPDEIKGDIKAFLGANGPS
ncbi:MAG: Eco29kI family restriction endonuclease [Proteobacteria bacterium]|nr:Eco29kI family restriction endonuclease [Pseudomonadota bacterium]